MNFLIILGIGVLSLVTVAHYLLKADRSLVCRPPDFPKPRADYPGTPSGRVSRVFKRSSAPRRDGSSGQVPTGAT